MMMLMMMNDIEAHHKISVSISIHPSQRQSVMSILVTAVSATDEWSLQACSGCWCCECHLRLALPFNSTSPPNDDR